MDKVKETKQKLSDISSSEYKYGFKTEIEEERLPNGLNEDIIKSISKIKNEPKWLLDFRLKSYEKWKKMKEPSWQNLNYPKIDFNEICYYSSPKKRNLKV